MSDELIELKRRAAALGYGLVQRSAIRRYTSTASFDKDMLLSDRYPHMRIVREQLAMNLAHALVSEDAVSFREDQIGVVNVSYVATLEAVVPPRDEIDSMLYLRAKP